MFHLVITQTTIDNTMLQLVNWKIVQHFTSAVFTSWSAGHTQMRFVI